MRKWIWYSDITINLGARYHRLNYQQWAKISRAIFSFLSNLFYVRVSFIYIEKYYKWINKRNEKANDWLRVYDRWSFSSQQGKFHHWREFSTITNQVFLNFFFSRLFKFVYKLKKLFFFFTSSNFSQLTTLFFLAFDL